MYRICAEILCRLLSDREWEQLTQDWYQQRQWQNPLYLTDELFDWETGALRKFPGSPSAILVFAAGKGREIRALQKKGYQVFGVEMDTDCFKSLLKTCDASQTIGLSRASFLDVVDGVEKLPEYTFGAIIIGWAAILHMPSRETLYEFFRILFLTYPKVPVLVSSSPALPPRSLYNLLLRRVATNDLPQQGFRRAIHPWFGPCGHIDTSSMEKIFRTVGYELIYCNPDHEYPHWVLS